MRPASPLSAASTPLQPPAVLRLLAPRKHPRPPTATTDASGEICNTKYRPSIHPHVPCCTVLQPSGRCAASRSQSTFSRTSVTASVPRSAPSNLQVCLSTDLTITGRDHLSEQLAALLRVHSKRKIRIRAICKAAQSHGRHASLHKPRVRLSRRRACHVEAGTYNVAEGTKLALWSQSQAEPKRRGPDGGR